MNIMFLNVKGKFSVDFQGIDILLQVENYPSNPTIVLGFLIYDILHHEQARHQTFFKASAVFGTCKSAIFTHQTVQILP